MVGIFSRFSGSKSAGHHRRAQSAVSCSCILACVEQDQRQVVVPPNEDAVGITAISAAAHGIAVAVEFKPVEHPAEPVDYDPPVKCPLPEPSILNDGRIWKERMSATVPRPAELPAVKDGISSENVQYGSRSRSTHSGRSILPSLSAPEHNIINLLEECNAAGI